MSNSKHKAAEKEQNNVQAEETVVCEKCTEETVEAVNSNEAGENTDAKVNELDILKKQLEEKATECSKYVEMLQRQAAEFDNFRKRTLKEKQGIRRDAVSDTVSEFLPVIDNLERAIQASGKEEDFKALKEGIELVYRQISDVLKNMGVQQIPCVGEKFDPQLHNAVMHIDDTSFDENTVIEEFQKGYIMDEKVIRHSVVKVAN